MISTDSVASALAAVEQHDASSIGVRDVLSRSWITPWEPPAGEEPPREFEGIEMPVGVAAPELAVLRRLALTRRSDRRESPEPLDDEVLSGILSANRSAGGLARRPYPSAGARFPVELHLVALRCAGLERGVYRISPAGDRICRGTTIGDLGEELRRSFGYDWIHGSRAIIVMAGDLERTCIKYGTRGYRYALLECGHIAQNLLLAAAACATAACPVGGFADEEVSRLLELRTPGVVPMYAVVLP